MIMKGYFFNTKEKTKAPHHVKNLGVIKKKIIKINGHTKLKYYCPIEQDTYLAQQDHIHCQLCFDKNRQIDRHEIVEYDPKIHKIRED